MKNSQFWVMCKKHIPSPTQFSEHYFPGSKLPDLCIVELTPDELVYIWPKEPLFESLCMICKNFLEKSDSVCKTDVLIGRPCRFDPYPEAPQCQDIDDFLIDGEFLVECGYFHSFEDFKKQNGFNDYNCSCEFLGEFASIRFARLAININKI